MARSEGGTEDAADTRDEDRVGRAIGKYTLARVIGRGGMGIVYEAQNTAIGKRVAIKLVSADLAKNKDAVKRFQREAQAASAVESAHIVDIFDAGVSDDGVPYIVMELLRGEDLGHRIKRLGRLDLDEALHVTVQILRGLARAHAAGIVHRDLKPDNIFLVDRDDDDSFVKILDFGISKVARRGETPVQTLTKQGTVLGTPFYMAPEQAQGLPDTDGRADLWSTGAILYECLTGRAPHTGASYEQVIVNICSKDAADVRTHNPAVPEPIAKVIARALARDRDERFATARELMEALVIASGGVVTTGPRSSDEPSDPSGRAPILPGSGSHRRVSSSGGTLRLGSGSDPGRMGSGDHARNVGPAVPSGALRASTSGFEDTLEMKGGGPSRVGWATSGGSAVRRDRRRVLAMTLGALGLAAVVTIGLAVRKPSDPSAGADAVVPVDHRSVSGETSTQVRPSAPVPEATSPSSRGDDGAPGHAGATSASGAGSQGAATPPRSDGDAVSPRSKTASPKPTSAPTAKPGATASATASTAAPAVTSAPTAAPASTPTLTIRRD